MEVIGNLFRDLPEQLPPGVSWRRHPRPCRADQEMLIAGKPNGLWIMAAQHPTALRPYYIVLPNGRNLPRKYSRLEDAKPAAILALAATDRAETV